MKYTEIIESKDGNLIPLIEKTALHSKYNVKREGETFASQFTSEGFFIVLGLAGGYHISAILEKFPNSKIIVIENSDEDIKFLKKIPEIKNLKNDKRVKFSTEEKIENTILLTYKPALHGNLTITSLRAWENIFKEEKNRIIEKIQNTIKILSADFSVQSHFGKIWQKNIFENLKIASKVKCDVKKTLEEISTEKIAAIIAAGPTFDETFEELKKYREKYFVIATDTAFSTLEKRKIKADVVVSVDGQNVSHVHYMHSFESDTIFVFDLCANNSAVKTVFEKTKKIIFANTGHPLVQYASTYSGKNSFIKIETGSGTVTIAAANFAILLGFSKIQFFGADFSYINGKSYTKGTYLDSNFRKDENKTDNAETRFSALMFRTELKNISKKRFTTEVLKSYEKSLNDFMKKNGFEEKNNEKIRFFESTNNKQPNFDLKNFNFEDFIKFYRSKLEEKMPEEDSLEMMTLLPFAAKLKSAILAYSKTLEYTRKL